MKGLGHERLKRLFGQHAGVIGDTKRVGLMSFGFKAAVPDDAKNKRDLVVTANTDMVDLDDEIVVPNGGDISHYKANGANFLDHNYSFESHVGTLRTINPDTKGMDQRSWINRSFIFSGLKNPMADDLWRVSQIAGIGSSIGYEELEGSPPSKSDPVRYQKAGWITRKWRMIELSFTAMPCNVGCRSHDESGMDESKMGVFDDLVTKGRGRGGIDLKSAILLGFPHKSGVSMYTAQKRLPPCIDLTPKLPPIISLDMVEQSV